MKEPSNDSRHRYCPFSGVYACHARLAVGCAALFAALLITLHLVEPEFDPLWRMISEYELGAVGWLMRVAFFAWGASVLLLVYALWPWLQTPGAVVGRWWMAVIGVSMIVAGIFEPNPITENTTNLHNTVHTVCGAVVILTFPIASTLVSRSLGRTQRLRRLALILTLMVWIGMVAYCCFPLKIDPVFHGILTHPSGKKLLLSLLPLNPL